LCQTQTRSGINNRTIHNVSYDFDDVGSIRWRKDNLQNLQEDFDYDMFLSADPNIQFAKVQQSYNRYSYVSNNPLKYTDPTGYVIDIFEIFDDFIKDNETQKNKIQDENQQKIRA
jgi:hypothetical protein